VEAGAAFPVTFDHPGDEAYAWDLDDMHWPYALTPLAADYVRLLASAMNERYLPYDFPQRWRAQVVNGYAYFALIFDGTDEEFEAVSTRWEQVWRDQFDTMGDWWRAEAMP